MKALIAELEKAEEGSRELDGDIALLIGWTKNGKGWAHWIAPEGSAEALAMGRRTNIAVPFYTDSLDDALTLYKQIPDIIPADPLKVCVEALGQWQ